MSLDPNVAVAEETAVMALEEKGPIDEIIAANKDRPGATMLVLTLVQERVGYISPPMQAYIAQELGIPLSHLYGVLTFYSSFRTASIGKYQVSVCMGTACYVRGGPTLIEKLQQLLGVQLGETTEDGKYTLEICRCVGACSQAPVLMINEDILGRVNPSDMSKILRKYE